MELGRRAYLAVGATTVGGLAGCTGLTSGSAGSGESTAANGLTLSTLEVGGSPGNEMAVQPGGRVVLLDFFATWCAPCKPQMEILRSVRSDFPDVHMLSITWESEIEAIEQFWVDYEGTWPVASDPEVRTGEEYGVGRIPTLLVFDPEGREQWRHTGLTAEADIVTELEGAGANA